MKYSVYKRIESFHVCVNYVLITSFHSDKMGTAGQDGSKHVILGTRQTVRVLLNTLDPFD